MERYKLGVQQACTEDWAGMKPTACGAFCAGCNKQVIDLTKKSYTEIAEILNGSTGEVCGRMTKEQAGYEYEYAPVFSHVSWFRRGMIGAVLSFFVAVFTTNAQTTPNKPKTESVVKKKDTRLVFTGTVVDDSTKAPLSNVNVMLMNSAEGTVTDSLGNFKLFVDKKKYTDSTFQFSRLGCMSVQTKLKPGVMSQVLIKPEIVTLDAVVIEARDPYRDDPYIVGALPIIRYTVRVAEYKQSPPVDMMIRHYFGISYWD